MGWTVEWLEVARDDLREIVEYIARDNPEKASEEGTRIIVSIEQLSDFPEKGSVFQDYDFPKLHQLVVSNYRIIYHLRSDEVVEVWRIWHGARGDVVIVPPE